MKITIPKPCHENWETMTPEEKGRFCSVCSKTVRDFTTASDDEIMKSFSDSSEDICGNFYESQLNRNLHYSYINSVFIKFAAGFILTTGGLVSVRAQQNIPTDTLQSEKISEIVLPELVGKKSQKTMLGSYTIVPGSLLNAKENKPEDIISKLQGVTVNPESADSSGKPVPLRIGGAKSSLRDDQKPVVVVNGKVSSLEELERIDPDTIKTINIVKNASSIFSGEAKNGVIVVTTKKKIKK
ncbi:TonB-dependent receptor plug domain-containing protein [Chryseobacterium kwangjuense]|uniref:TonB-dependent receptor plug domain-containing protein n=1 Tax=Chryseobacterium kwangjuense TaxID=267125 RepID=A0ABW9JZW8_9FLAO